MSSSSKHRGAMASLPLAVALFCSCTDAFIQPQPASMSNTDDRLTLRGRVCTNPPDPSGFPVKVIFVVDQSGSMCISDPPGAQESGTFCQFLTDQGIIPPGTTRPARVRAMQQLIAQFRTQSAMGANVQLSIVPFETNIRPVWPPVATNNRFGDVNDTSLDAYVDSLQNQLGKGTDYQGAMAYAYRLINEDALDVKNRRPAELPRTRYVVVFLTDGTPYPRCSAIDSPPYAGPDNPEGKWEDSVGLGGPDGYCNIVDDQDAIAGFTPRSDRNQNYQIFGYVQKIMDAKHQFNIGDVRFHTVLLLNEAAMRACGYICTDVYGQYAGVAPADWYSAAQKIARWTLQRMALLGNGVYQEFLNGSIQSIGFGALDYTSLASPNVMKTLLVQSLRSVPWEGKREVDSDGDGLPDTLDNSFAAKTNAYVTDNDGDCFDDNFETRHADQGFVTWTKDARGCDPGSPLTRNCVCSDTDGDGLATFAEDFLASHTGMVDSDGDGIPDGMEARFRLDPATPDRGQDVDGDGVPDKDEYRADTDPTRPDRELYERDGYQYEVTATVRSDQSVCYDFAVTNLRLVTPPAAALRQGFNLFKVWFAEAPESGVATDYGEWRSACAWAQYDPPVRVPAGPELVLQDSNFHSPDRFRVPADYRRGLCVGAEP